MPVVVAWCNKILHWLSAWKLCFLKHSSHTCNFCKLHRYVTFPISGYLLLSPSPSGLPSSSPYCAEYAKVNNDNLSLHLRCLEIDSFDWRRSASGSKPSIKATWVECFNAWTPQCVFALSKRWMTMWPLPIIGRNIVVFCECVPVSTFAQHCLQYWACSLIRYLVSDCIWPVYFTTWFEQALHMRELSIVVVRNICMNWLLCIEDYMR